MNAQVQPSLLLKAIAAENCARCRAIFAGDEMTPEQFALSGWWKELPKIKRRALFLIAGIPDRFSVRREWVAMPDKHRAAIVLAAQAWTNEMVSIVETLKDVRAKARDVLEQEARKAMRLRVAA